MSTALVVWEPIRDGRTDGQTDAMANFSERYIDNQPLRGLIKFDFDFDALDNAS